MAAELGWVKRVAVEVTREDVSPVVSLVRAGEEAGATAADAELAADMAAGAAAVAAAEEGSPAPAIAVVVGTAAAAVLEGPKVALIHGWE